MRNGIVIRIVGTAPELFCVNNLKVWRRQRTPDPPQQSERPRETFFLDCPPATTRPGPLLPAFAQARDIMLESGAGLVKVSCTICNFYNEMHPAHRTSGRALGRSLSAGHTACLSRVLSKTKRRADRIRRRGRALPSRPLSPCRRKVGRLLPGHATVAPQREWPA